VGRSLLWKTKSEREKGEASPALPRRGGLLEGILDGRGKRKAGQVRERIGMGHKPGGEKKNHLPLEARAAGAWEQNCQRWGGERIFECRGILGGQSRVNEGTGNPEGKDSDSTNKVKKEGLEFAAASTIGTPLPKHLQRNVYVCKATRCHAKARRRE